jgi:hypothetical protein
MSLAPMGDTAGRSYQSVGYGDQSLLRSMRTNPELTRRDPE